MAFAGPADGLPEGNHLLGIGLETGSVQVWSFSLAPSHRSLESQVSNRVESHIGEDDVGLLVSDVRLHWVPSQYDRHTAAVRRLCWRTVGAQLLQLASCSDDHAVRVWDLTLASC